MPVGRTNHKAETHLAYSHFGRKGHLVIGSSGRKFRITEKLINFNRVKKTGCVYSRSTLEGTILKPINEKSRIFQEAIFYSIACTDMLACPLTLVIVGGLQNVWTFFFKFFFSFLTFRSKRMNKKWAYYSSLHTSQNSILIFHFSLWNTRRMKCKVRRLISYFSFLTSHFS